MLSIGDEKPLGEALGRRTRFLIDDAASIVLRNSGHWIREEQPEETAAALLRFL